MDYLVDPTIPDAKIPIDMLEISEIISSKIQNSNGEEFFMLQRYASALQSMDKYDISGRHMYENTYDDEELRLRDEFYRQKNHFYKEQQKLEK